MSRPTTPTQNRLKLKRSTTEDAVADERLWPERPPSEDAEAGMGGGRPTGGGGRALDWWRRPGLSKGSWPARTRRLVERAREAATRRLQAGVLVERVDTKRRQALATQRGAVPAWKPPRGRGAAALHLMETASRDTREGPIFQRAAARTFYAQRAPRPGPERQGFYRPRPGDDGSPPPPGRQGPVPFERRRPPEHRPERRLGQAERPAQLRACRPFA